MGSLGLGGVALCTRYCKFPFPSIESARFHSSKVETFVQEVIEAAQCVMLTLSLHMSTRTEDSDERRRVQPTVSDVAFYDRPRKDRTASGRYWRKYRISYRMS